jgi:pimeloyl-ACP methyl ester carboxylesterase
MTEKFENLVSTDFSAIDIPEVLSILFHPRPEPPGIVVPENCEVFSINVDEGIKLGARFYKGKKEEPLILFFHGNGEIAADYDDIGDLFVRAGMQLIVVDYRGYGTSGGRPGITSMTRDAHVILSAVDEQRSQLGLKGPFLVMGRSLGSASALEIAASHPEDIDGLIVESGFSSLGKLMARLGLSDIALKFFETSDFLNTDRIHRFKGPTLIIHAEMDGIIPIEQGLDLFEASGSKDKILLRIPGAGHNDIFVRGFSDYMDAVSSLCRRARSRQV